MWSAPAKVTFPDGNTIEDVVFGEYEVEETMETIAVFIRSENKERYMQNGGFAVPQKEIVLLETDIQDFSDLSSNEDEPYAVQSLMTGAGKIIVDWRR